MAAISFGPWSFSLTPSGQVSIAGPARGKFALPLTEQDIAQLRSTPLGQTAGGALDALTAEALADINRGLQAQLDSLSTPAPALSAGQQVQSQQNDSPLQAPAAPPAPLPGAEPPAAAPPTAGDDQGVPAVVSADQPQQAQSVTQDDAGAQSSQDPQVQQQLNEKKASQSQDKSGIFIFPQPNVLDSFATYTWSASLYVLTNEQFSKYTKTPVRDINSYLLLMQSGGAPNNQGGPQKNQGTVAALRESGGQHAGRNPYFGEDFYIDNIEIKTAASGIRGHAAQELKFTVTETENISLLDRLWQVVQNLNESKGIKNVNWGSMAYLLVIRFYGYDADGRPIQLGGNTSDPSAAIEKYYPFKVKEVKWRVSNRLVTYEWSGTPLGQDTAGSSMRATIKNDVELNGETVGDLLIGSVQYSATAAPDTNPGAGTNADGYAVGVPILDDTGAESSIAINPETGQQYDRTGLQGAAPPKATAAKSLTSGARGGLMSVMNEIAAKNAKDQKFKFADTYKLVFAQGAEAIRDSRITKAGSANKSRVNMGTSTSQNTQNASPDKQKMDPTTRIYSITAGTQLYQQIELIIRQSEYIANQASVKIDETTQEVVPNPGANKDGVNWFYIETYAIPKEYDEARNDYAYEMIFVIKPYRIADIFSPYFKIPAFPGVHKSYPYWFTGQNTAVLQYEAEFDQNYFHQLTGTTTNDLQKQQQTAIRAMRDIVKTQSTARSGETAQGAEGKANEVVASAADYLYGATNAGECVMKIIGDPAWMPQGEYTGVLSFKSSVRTPFLPDGTINFVEGQVMFEIVWQRPGTYDLATGLQDPYASQERQTGTREAIQSVVYNAKQVTSTFRGGKFEQQLEGFYYQYPKPDGTNAITKPAKTDDNAATPTASVPDGTAPATAADQRTTSTGDVQLPSTDGPVAEPQVDDQPPSSNSVQPEPEDPSPQPALPAGLPTSNGLPVGLAESVTAGTNTVVGALSQGVPTGTLTLNGVNILPSDPRYNDVAQQLVNSAQGAQNQVNQLLRQAQTMAREY